jgi:hypothetical protein
VTNVSAMSTLQLALIIQNLPERPVLWTAFERETRDEYDRRIAAVEEGLAA